MIQKKWQALKIGDIVEIVAPASACKESELDAACKWIRSLRLIPRIPLDVMKGKFIFAQSRDYQFEHMKKALQTKDSKAIWCLRGGYGSMRILPQLDKIKKIAGTKLFIGYSDITALHLYLNQKWNLPTIHGPTFNRMGHSSQPLGELREIEKLIFGKLDEIEFKGLIALNEMAHKKNIINSKVVGGNLSLITSSLGTPWQINSKGKILFLEDVDERGYKVDRMLEQLKQAQVFSGARAIVLGDFIGGNEPRIKKNYVQRVLREFANQTKIPVLKGIKSGHGALIRPLPLNTTAKLILSHKNSLICKTNVKN